jgi:putative FmdB family regulatory protein
MPTFDFRCKKCSGVFEEKIPFGSKKLPPCPSCNAKATEKLMTPPMGIHFKGSGFYKTDSSGRKPSSKPALEQSPAAAPTSEKPDPGAELRPAEKKPESSTKPDSGAKSTPSSKKDAV